MDILSAIQGLSFSLPDLYQQISNSGWEVKKVKYDSGKDRFLASATASHGEEIEAWGPSEKVAVANLLLNITHRNGMRMGKISMWKTDFVTMLPQIAEAYSKAPIYEPKAAISFMELGRDAEARAKALMGHLEITVTNNPEPYPHPEKMFDDIRKRRKLEVSRAGIEHPIWSDQQSIAFRIAFDVLGYCAASSDWGWEGTNRAFAAYAAMIPAEAQTALFTQVIGQTAYATYYRAYGPQKIALLKEFIEPAQSKENPHKLYRGVHPSQAYAPLPEPSVKPVTSHAGLDPIHYGEMPQKTAQGLTGDTRLDELLERYRQEFWGGAQPGDIHPEEVEGLCTAYAHELAEFLQKNGITDAQVRYVGHPSELGYTDRTRVPEPDEGHAVVQVGPHTIDFNAAQYGYSQFPMIIVDGKRLSKVATALSDPNEGWDSGVAPLPINAYLDHGDPLGAQDVMHNASLIDTEWAYLNQEDPAELERMKLAITNAFRAVLLSPRKDLKWNSIHYQDISHIPSNEDDPDVYWDTLEQARQNWNVKRHGEDARYQHMPYYKQWKALEQLTYQKDPQSGWPAAIEKAKRFLHRMQQRYQEMIMREDADLPEEQQRNMYQIEQLVNKEVTQELRNYIREHQLGFDFESAVSPQQIDMGIDDPRTESPDKSKYGTWMGTHLQAIAQISQHIDETLKAALTDVHERDGTGHHFRATVLSLNIAGVGPKVCSFAWLLLQPLTSQLATIDVHMMRVLDHDYEREMNNRDYFKFERELAAGRDAAGYGHVPLGAFQWGMWDMARTGPGSHQDHSALKVLDPVSHEQIDWKAKLSPGAPTWTPPDWWLATKPARDAVAAEWDQQIAPNMPSNTIPYNQGVPPAVYAKTAASTLTPWLIHPHTGEKIVGLPGQSILQHAMSLGIGIPEVWQLEAGKD